jgi:hypothetical protein
VGTLSLLLNVLKQFRLLLEFFERRLVGIDQDLLPGIAKPVGVFFRPVKTADERRTGGSRCVSKARSDRLLTPFESLPSLLGLVDLAHLFD